MLKILSASQIQDTDKYTIQNEPIASIDLMERASKAFVNWFVDKFDNSRPVKIFCGSGNNGGDGLAISRLLMDKKYKVQAYGIRKSKDKGSDDFKINYKRLSEMIGISEVAESKDMPEIGHNEIVIEGIFGSGLSRPVEGYYAEIIEKINQAGAITISIDIASGLFCDKIAEGTSIIKPNFTVSFQLPKMAFLLPENDPYVGNWTFVDIGLDVDYITKQDSPYYWIEQETVRARLKKRRKHAHKGDYGKALLVSGGLGKMGAAVLAARGCMRAGAGLLTLHIPRCGNTVLQTAIPEAMVMLDSNEERITDLLDLTGYSAIGAGPGLGTHKDTVRAIEKLLQVAKAPLILDADALNILSNERQLLEVLSNDSILTPHPKEFNRLTGEQGNSMDRITKQREFSKEYKVNVVLKGAYTSISDLDGNLFFNSTGNPGMATGGSGDVLTGVITGLLAQGYIPIDAAIIGVYLHGLAGDIAAKSISEPALIAGDIIDNLGNAYKKLYKI